MLIQAPPPLKVACSYLFQLIIISSINPLDDKLRRNTDQLFPEPSWVNNSPKTQKGFSSLSSDIKAAICPIKETGTSTWINASTVLSVETINPFDWLLTEPASSPQIRPSTLDRTQTRQNKFGLDSLISKEAAHEVNCPFVHWRRNNKFVKKEKKRCYSASWCLSAGSGGSPLSVSEE